MLLLNFLDLNHNILHVHGIPGSGLTVPQFVYWVFQLRVLICYGFFTESIFCFKDRANEIYKKVEDQKPLKGRNQEAISAACLYIACRQENKPRTVKGREQLSGFFLLYVYESS